MAFEGLTEKLSAAFKKLRGKGRLSEADVKEAMKEIRMALLEADGVNSFAIKRGMIFKFQNYTISAERQGVFPYFAPRGVLRNATMA